MTTCSRPTPSTGGEQREHDRRRRRDLMISSSQLQQRQRQAAHILQFIFLRAYIKFTSVFEFEFEVVSCLLLENRSLSARSFMHGFGAFKIS